VAVLLTAACCSCLAVCVCVQEMRDLQGACEALSKENDELEVRNAVVGSDVSIRFPCSLLLCPELAYVWATA
jgi:hypothetical protein